MEDDPDQRELLRFTLEEHFGANTVTEVDCRRTALDQDLASFDLILTDYNLPDATGLDLLDDVRRRCQTPVIIVTGENVGQIAADAVRRGATDYVVKFGDYLFTIPLVVEKNLAQAKIREENEQLRNELERALSDVKVKNNQLRDTLNRVEELAATDPLTGLYNRRHFGKVLDQLFSEASRYQSSLSCAMIDLDGYKQLNDSYGHAVGDQLLVVVGKVIGANMRRMDVAARFGGDEFILLLPHAGEVEAATVVNRIREDYRSASAVVLNRPQGVTMSVGIAGFVPIKMTSTDHLAASADDALYRAKRGGRNRVVLASTPEVIPLAPAIVAGTPLAE